MSGNGYQLAGILVRRRDGIGCHSAATAEIGITSVSRGHLLIEPDKVVRQFPPPCFKAHKLHFIE
jgi:hypothetical protein